MRKEEQKDTTTIFSNMNEYLAFYSAHKQIQQKSENPYYSIGVDIAKTACQEAQKSMAKTIASGLSPD